MKWAFNQVLEAIKFVNDVNKRNYLDSEKTTIVSAINDKNVAKANYLIDRYKLNILSKEVAKEVVLA